MAIKDRIERAVAERSLLDGMRRAFRAVLDRQAENSSKIPDLGERKERLRALKERSVGDEELFISAVAALRENGIRVLIAKTASAAVEAIEKELAGYDLVVKSKSNVTKELHLAENLSRAGLEVVETDLGDRIVQLAGCEAVHPTGPACHLTRQEIAALFSEHFGRGISDDPRELTESMKNEIATYLARATAGITGANAITAAEGAVVIVHNEGNAAKCAMLPGKHIIVATPDKVVPTLEDAMGVIKLQTYLSTGKVVSSFVNIVSGPSYTSDIEKQLYRGMHGPKEIVLLFVDNGRISAEDKQPQFCIGCGMCLLTCPVYAIIGPAFGTPGHMGGLGVYLAGSIGKLDESLDGGLLTCVGCGLCTEVCPSRIDTREGVFRLRTEARGLEKGRMEEHSELVSSVRNYANPWKVPRAKKAKWAEGLELGPSGEVIFFAGCSTSLLLPDSARAPVGVLRSAGVYPGYLGRDEPCCGSTVRKVGEDGLAREKAEECFRQFSRAGARTVVTSCPGCYSALSRHSDLSEKYGIRVAHIGEFLAEIIDQLPLEKVDLGGPITYHDPCDLGRAQGVYEQPRRLIQSASRNRFVEMERSGQDSSCCGSGGGVKSNYPSLSAAIAQDRLAMAREVGAMTIITACPWCVQGLRDGLGDSEDVRVIDLVELLSRSVGSRSSGAGGGQISVRRASTPSQ